MCLDDNEGDERTDALRYICLASVVLNDLEMIKNNNWSRMKQYYLNHAKTAMKTLGFKLDHRTLCDILQFNEGWSDRFHEKWRPAMEAMERQT
jgi:hypothetical protein